MSFGNKFRVHFKCRSGYVSGHMVEIRPGVMRAVTKSDMAQSGFAPLEFESIQEAFEAIRKMESEFTEANGRSHLEQCLEVTVRKSSGRGGA